MFSTSNNAFGRAGLALLAFVASLSPISAHAEDMGSYACPVRGDAIEKVTEETKFSDFHGVRYYFCCEVCKPQFDKTQAKFLKNEKNKGKVIGMSLFDPVTTKRIEPEKAKYQSDYSGVRYFFAKEDDKKSFDKEPKKFTVVPKKELLFCPVSNEIVETYAKASDYSDYKGTRYFFCCAGCKPQFDKDQEKYLVDLDARVKAAEQKKAAEEKKSPDAKSKDPI